MEWHIQSFLNETFNGLTWTLSDEKGVLAEGLSYEQANKLYRSHMDNPRDCDCDNEYYECNCGCG